MKLFNHTLFLLCFIVLFSFGANAQLNTLGATQKTLTSAENVVNKTSEYVQKIDAAVDYVKNNNLYKALIDGKEFTFPIGVLPNSGDNNYALVINKVFMNSDGMFAEIFMKVTVSSGHPLYFLADKVPFSRSGGIAGDLRLYLLKTDSLQVGKGYTILFDGLEKGGTEKSCFATFNCKGFKDATLAGAVNFSRSAIVKDTVTKEAVSLKYYVQADKLSNFIIQFKDIPKFEFANLPGFKCYVKELTLDQSEVKNAPAFKLPKWYNDSIRVAVNNPTLKVDGPDWQGVYIPNIEIDIPTAFKEEKPTQIVTIRAKDLIVDQNGITVVARADSLLKGKIKGWKYSIDSIYVNLIASTLSKGSIFGKTTLPICKDGSMADYGLIITKKLTDADASYKGYLTTNLSLEAQAFGVAKIKISRATFELEYTNKQFYPAAVITGNLTLGAKKDTASKAKSFASFGIDFALLRLTTKSPYIDVDKGGYVKMSDQGSMMSNFPVSISELGIKKGNADQSIGICMTLNVKLQKSGGDSKGSSGFGGSASFTVWAKRDPVAQKWKYDKFDLDKIIIDVNNSSFSLHGELSTFQDDTLYGTGFCGYLDLKVVKKIAIQAGAIFGRVKQMDPDNPPSDTTMADTPVDYRYWFVDAAATFPVITVCPVVGINGFIGGLYHNMAMKKAPDPKKPATKVDCKTASGMKYYPDNKIFLGLMAGVGLQSVPTDAVYNGKITFGLEFNNSGGLNMVAIWGGVTVFTPPLKVPDVSALKGEADVQDTIPAKSAKKAEPKDDVGSVRVMWFTQYDVPNETFIGDFDVFIDVAGVVKGTQAKSKAGHIAVFFSPKSQYVYIGTPMEPVGIDVLGLFKATSYFCAGNELPNPPIAPLPPEVHVSTPLDYSSLETGAGLSFGARVSLDGKFGAEAEILKCELFVGAEIWVKAGFDVLISKSNSPVYCKAGERRGINDWYATGQAFIAGGLRLGVDYDCGILGSGSKNLLSASLSAYLFAQLPKPSYLVGEVTAEFEILGLSGKAHFDVQFGEQCKKAELDKNVVFISTILPDSGQTNVKVSEKIVINFAKPIFDFKFPLPDEGSTNGSNILYWGFVDPAKNVIITHNSKNIAFTANWNSSHTKLVISPTSVLPENANIRVDVQVELRNSKGTASGKSESRSITFKTAIEPTKIDLANIACSYPLPGMENYYTNEANSGYIKLFTLPNKPMKLVQNYAYHVVFYADTSNREVARVTNVIANNATGVEQFTYLIPNDKLGKGSLYTLKLVKAPSNIQIKQVEDPNDKSYTIGNVKDTPKDSVVLEYKFTTSKFSSFSQKIASFNQSKVEVSGTNVTHTLQPNQEEMGDEDLSYVETSGYVTSGVRTSKQLVQALGADFTSGVVVKGNVPDSIAYSFYSGSLVVQYNVFNEIELMNNAEKKANITCAVNGVGENCSSSGSSYTFPKGKYLYKLGYFLPGRNTKTSEVIVSFDLPKEVVIAY